VEGQTQELELEDIQPQAFNIFVNWLYTQEIKDVHGKIPTKNKLCELWILADRFLIPKLQNQAMLYLGRPTTQKSISTSCAQRVYSSTAKGSPLRNFVADLLANSIVNNFREFKENSDRSWVPVELLWDAVDSIQLRLPKGTKLPTRPVDHYNVNEDLTAPR
jgi:hypothetical protein